MATFTPPTHTEYFAPAGVDRLWSRVPFARGNSVLIQGGATLSGYPDQLVVESDAIIAAQADGYAFLGGSVTTFLDIDAELLLVGSGYEAQLTGEDWPAAIL